MQKRGRTKPASSAPGRRRPNQPPQPPSRRRQLRPAELAEYPGVSAVYLTALELGAIGQRYPHTLHALASLLDLEPWTDLLRPPADRAAREAHDRTGHPARRATKTPPAVAAERLLRRRSS